MRRNGPPRTCPNCGLPVVGVVVDGEYREHCTRCMWGREQEGQLQPADGVPVYADVVDPEGRV